MVGVQVGSALCGVVGGSGCALYKVCVEPEIPSVYDGCLWAQVMPAQRSATSHSPAERPWVPKQNLAGELIGERGFREMDEDVVE